MTPANLNICIAVARSCGIAIEDLRGKSRRLDDSSSLRLPLDQRVASELPQ